MKMFVKVAAGEEPAHSSSTEQLATPATTASGLPDVTGILP